MKHKISQTPLLLCWERGHPVRFNVRDHVAGRQAACSLWNSQIAQITQMVKTREKRPGLQGISGVDPASLSNLCNLRSLRIVWAGEL